MEEWGTKWLHTSMLRLHTLMPEGFTIRNLSNASYTFRAATKTVADVAQSARWLRQIDARPSKSGKSIEEVYTVTIEGRTALIAATSPLHQEMQVNPNAAPSAYFRSIIQVESSLAIYLGKVAKGEDTFPTLPDGENRVDDHYQKHMKTCFADYEALKDIEPSAASQVRTRLWSAILQADEGHRTENPRYKGNLIDYFKGEG